MPVGTQVDLGSGHIVLDEDPAPPKGAQPPIFGPCLLWPKGRPSQLLLNTYHNGLAAAEANTCRVIVHLCQ